jgi:hypothetical protein
MEVFRFFHPNYGEDEETDVGGNFITTQTNRK